ncbi:MAG TPA: DUF4328 domain-containing protein [Ilumatobacteraceae bacterium]|nr:DUF4328 domain-containing protein [Ilumatobacteraceae bacterium]
MSEFPNDSAFPKPPPPPDMAPPPGYVGYGAAPTPGYGQYRRIGGQAKALRVLLAIFVVASVISLALLPSAKSKALAYVNGTGSLSDYEDALGPWSLANSLVGGVTVAIAVLVMIWMNRMTKNLQLIGRVGTWTPGWAIGGWFLPPVLFVIPYLMLRDLWKGSDPQSQPNWRSNPVAPIVHVWWALYGVIPLAFVTVTFSRFSFSFDNDNIDQAKNLSDSFGITMAAQAIQIGAAVALLLLVTQLTKRHTEITREA